MYITISNNRLSVCKNKHIFANKFFRYLVSNFYRNAIPYSILNTVLPLRLTLFTEAITCLFVSSSCLLSKGFR